MESGRSDLTRAASSSQGSAAGGGKEKKNRAALPLSVDEGRDAAGTGTEPRSTWTGQKRTKIESTSISDEDLCDMELDDNTGHSSGKIAREQEQIEGIDWDKDKLRKEINCYLGRLHDGPSASYACDDEGLWVMYNEEELTTLNRRLALCRIRAHGKKYRGLDDAALSDLFPPSVLEENGYFKHYEDRFEWYFDPGYCEYARFQDYQRLMLRDNGEFDEYEYYRNACSTLEGDQQFVQFWEKLSIKTKLVELYQTDKSSDTRIMSLFVYHALKITAGLPHVYKTLIISGYNDALMHVYDKGNTPSVFLRKTVFEQDLRLMEKEAKPHLDRIVEKAQEGDVHKLIMDAVKEIVGERVTYYDFVKKKLCIAREIGLIPLNP